MWIYIPTLLASAPEEADSISDSSWQCRVLEASVSWRGKLSDSRNWSARCRKVSWLRPLYGAMSPPSTADHGAELWMASLAESRASLIASPASEAAKTTNAISGPTRGASSSSPARGSSSSKTSAACSRRSPALIRARYGSGVTYSDWVSTLREDCSRRQKSAQATSASASLSSQWPTSSSWDWKDTDGMATTGINPDGSVRERNDQLARAVFQWSTPRASGGEKGGPNQRFGAGGMPLVAQTVQWATPSVADTTGGRMARSGDRADEPLLKGQAAILSDQWMTPRTVTGAYTRDGGDPDKERLTLEGQAILAAFLPVHPTYPVGGISLKERRSLNPLFVEWLMGWPPGWTLLAWTDFACSETELSRFKQRMRYELLRIGLPKPAPPAQLGLFT